MYELRRREVGDTAGHEATLVTRSVQLISRNVEEACQRLAHRMRVDASLAIGHVLEAELDVGGQAGVRRQRRWRWRQWWQRRRRRRSRDELHVDGGWRHFLDRRAEHGGKRAGIVCQVGQRRHDAGKRRPTQRRRARRATRRRSDARRLAHDDDTRIDARCCEDDEYLALIDAYLGGDTVAHGIPLVRTVVAQITR